MTTSPPPNETGSPSAAARARFRPWQRLHAPREYRHVFRTGFKGRDDLFMVVAAPAGQQHARLGLAVSRKAAKLATRRNRIKRLVRQAFRADARRLPPVDVVVVALPGIASRSNAEIRQSLRSHWTRIARRCAKSPTSSSGATRS